MKPLPTILILIVAVPASIMTKLFIEEWWNERKVHAFVRDSAMAELTKTKLNRLVEAIDGFSNRTGQLPERLAELPVCPTEDYSSAAISSCPKAAHVGADEDGWGRPFLYSPSRDGSYLLSSPGSDGEAGGIGPADDIIHVGSLYVPQAAKR